ncbi:hypothetical protein HPB51_028715 [Rhipicephalus microplus]|uniref:Uncharacterized protein n=1 Tax=Rhipicephalus microplus TaxID=6941 RepID=A0A9J6CW64_RHIMP|nr:hypothetical protein HPB51_028715 [Rhipicephalus microplus]
MVLAFAIIHCDSPDQLDCMYADDFEPMGNVGPSDSTPGLSGVADASNNTYLRPSVPHTPWFRMIDAHRKKVVAEEASATPAATFPQREHRHRTGRPHLPRLPVEDHKKRRCENRSILNPSEHYDGCVPRCLTCGSDKHHPTIDLGCQARQRRPGPRVRRDERQLLEKPNYPPLRQHSEQLLTNNQPRRRPQDANSEGHALPRQEPTYSPGLEASAATPSSSGLASGGRLDEAPQSQLPRQQDILANPEEKKDENKKPSQLQVATGGTRRKGRMSREPSKTFQEGALDQGAVLGGSGAMCTEDLVLAWFS